jgi:hypothetical protein
MMALLEEKKSSGREDYNVPIFGFPCSAFRGNLVILCHPSQRSKMRLIVSLRNLEDLYGAQDSSFTIFHH